VVMQCLYQSFPSAWQLSGNCKNADAIDPPRLLSPRHDRKRCCTSEPSDELAPFHSITLFIFLFF
jgi:hypothetical protein